MLELISEDFNAALALLQRAGFRLDVIYPADAPCSAVLSHGDGSIRLNTPDAVPLQNKLPAFAPDFVLTRNDLKAAQGRAGMLYRDLIPTRLGGRYIASHITLPGGGHVDDWAHYHRISLQLIVVRRGWVRVVYEGQGDPIVMSAGDMVLQPPFIRHRVLESSAGLEVIEITAPALHETFADHELVLPNGEQPGRDFGGQFFSWNVASTTPWTPFLGAEAQQTQIGEAANGLVEARTIRRGKADRILFEPHQGELVFGFMLEGEAQIEHEAPFDVKSGDAFVIPPGKAWALGAMTNETRLLHVTTSRLNDALTPIRISK